MKICGLHCTFTGMHTQIHERFHTQVSPLAWKGLEFHKRWHTCACPLASKGLESTRDAYTCMAIGIEGFRIVISCITYLGSIPVGSLITCWAYADWHHTHMVEFSFFCNRSMMGCLYCECANARDCKSFDSIKMICGSPTS